MTELEILREQVRELRARNLAYKVTLRHAQDAIHEVLTAMKLTLVDYGALVGSPAAVDLLARIERWEKTFVALSPALPKRD